MAVWYKAGLNVIGSPVSAWNTSGGSAGTNITQSTLANRPNQVAGSTNYKRYNYNPRIDFVASSSTCLENVSVSEPNLYGTAGSIFLVSDQNTTSGTAVAYSYSLSTNRIQIKPNFRVQTSGDGVNGTTADWGVPTEYSTNSASLISVTGLGPSATHRRNSVTIPCSNCMSPTYLPAITTGLRVGRRSTTLAYEYIDSDLGEIIFYSTALTTANVDRIESYLAIKYGITRGGNTGTGTAYNYVNSSGTAVWNKATNAGYNNDIAGIGRDDNSALVQKQSISVNNNEPVSIGLVSVDADNAANANSFSSNNSFLMWGNDGGALHSIYNDVTCFTNLPPGVQARIKRRWKAQVTNFTQAVTLGFENSMLTGYTPLANLRLLVDNDGSDWSNATVYSGAVLDGTRIEFAGVAITGATPYFTLATINYNNTPLPVELLYFDASPDNAKVRLKWSTATERGSDRFEIERSADGHLFHLLQTVPAAGNSQALLTYGSIDQGPLPGTSYYRLRQVDMDGSWRYSNAVPVHFSGVARQPFITYDLAQGSASLMGYDPQVLGPLRLLDVHGAMVPLVLRSEDPWTIDLNGLAPGLYMLVMNGTALRVMVSR